MLPRIEQLLGEAGLDGHECSGSDDNVPGEGGFVVVHASDQIHAGQDFVVGVGFDVNVGEASGLDGESQPTQRSA